MSEVTLKELKKVAEELNDVMGLKPEIDVDLDEDELLALVKEAIGQIDPDVDEFTKPVQALINKLAEDEPKEEKKPAKGAKKKVEEDDDAQEKPAKGSKKKEPEPEPEADDVVTELKELLDEIEAAKKRSALLAIAKEHDEFKTVLKNKDDYEEVDELREAMLDALKPAKKAEKGAKKKVEDDEDEPKKAKKAKDENAKPARKTSSKQKIEFLTPFITEGKYKKSELIQMCMDEFPDSSVSGLQTLLTDGKNPKYNKFPKLIIQNDEGLMKFGKK